MMFEQLETGRAFKLSILTAAVGAGTMGAADAATISKVPTGYVPVVFTTNVASSRSFDTDGNGTQDFTISSSGTYILIAAPLPANTYSAFFNVNSYSSPNSFQPVTSLKNNSSGNESSSIVSISSSGGQSNFSPNVPMYAEVATNVAYSAGSITSGTVGYILGTLAVVSGAGTSSEVDSFTVSDFGVIATSVPEPSALALLAMGGAGVAALRRRQAVRRGRRAN